MKRLLLETDEWLRRRIRMCIWKTWKKVKTKVANLIRCGIGYEIAQSIGNVAKTEHSHPLGMVVSTHFRCGKGVKRGLKNGALPFNID